MYRNEQRRRGAWRALVGMGLIVALGTGACAGSRGAGGARRPSSPTEILAGELADARDASSVFGAIERLRPLFFRPRAGPRRVRGVAPVLSVYINGSFAGAPDVLRTVLVDDVARVRFLQPAQAMTQYGSVRSGDGVIEVTLKGPGQ